MTNLRTLAVLAITTASLASQVLGDGESCGSLSGEDVYCPQETMEICQGDTRGDQKCNHDVTHRVCAKIGDPDTSFFEFTGQANIGKGTEGWHGNGWCNTAGSYDLAYSPHGHDVRCPEDNPTWCICKWATASWIKGEGCTDGVEIDCPASDICSTPNGLFFSYKDGGVDLGPAKECVPTKCPEIWESCCAANPGYCSTDEVSPTLIELSAANSADIQDSEDDSDSMTANVAIAFGACGAALVAAVGIAYVVVTSRKGAAESTAATSDNMEMQNI